LIIQDILQSQSIDNITVEVIVAINVIIQDVLQLQYIEDIAITQNHVLSIDNLLQSQQIEPISISQGHNLLIDDMLQMQFIIAITITQIHNLIIQDMLQGGGIGQRNIIRRWNGREWEFYGYVNGIVSFQSSSSPNVAK
jgi:hypothetical protein